MNKQVQFVYQIKKAGVAHGKLVIHDSTVPFEVTNVSNPLYDLLKGLVGLIYEPSHLWDEENICWIDWYCDQKALKWILRTPDGKNINIKILQLEDIFDESTAKVVLESTCKFTEFYQAIIFELDHFIKEIGLLNYEQLWQKDEFPLTYFLILKKHLIEHGRWDASDTEGTNLFDEINLLQA
ncbi:hypothetical protein E9993_02935 [Labilibacter sediminis]|nr:hypothetical protein E9993_02935 [Labilibacter sediminis]